MKKETLKQKGSVKQSEHNRAKASLIKLSIDMAKRQYVVVRQVEGGSLEPPQRFEPERFYQWLAKQQTQAPQVVVCYEAGPFGFAPARRIKEMGAECLVMAPVKLDERNKRVNTDRSDAREIAVRLDRYCAGNQKALVLVRIPTEAQERERAQSRQYEQLREHRACIRRQVKSYLLTLGLEIQNRWWVPSLWAVAENKFSAQVLEMLKPWRPILLALDQQINAALERLRRAAAEHLPVGMKQLPLGMGELSFEQLRREVVAWDRFRNRRQPGSMTGLCPSEASTGQSRRQGSISKYGNARLRAILVELAWRIVRYQPRYGPVVYWWKRVLAQGKKAGAAARKKAIVALARRLMVDLWRLATGQTTAEKLGLLLKGQRLDQALSARAGVLIGAPVAA